MILVIEEYPPPNTVWSMSCWRGEPDVGYTCGLWELFHVITVGVVDYNRAAAFAGHRLATEAVARTIRDYVDQFFGCEICRRNFVTAFDACAHQRCARLLLNATSAEKDWIQLPLWLLETHNAVNVRLQAEKAVREHRPKPTRPEEISATWPPVKDCPLCWQNEVLNDELVYKYLKLEYGLRDPLSSEYKRELFPPAVLETSWSPQTKEVGWWSLFMTNWTPSNVPPLDNRQRHKRKRVNYKLQYVRHSIL